MAFITIAHVLKNMARQMKTSRRSNSVLRKVCRLGITDTLKLQLSLKKMENLAQRKILFLDTYSSNYWKADHSTEVVIGYEPTAIGYCPKYTRHKS